MTPAYPRHLCTLAIAAGTALALLAAFNLLADPYGCFNLLPQTRLSQSRAGLGNHVGKAEMIVHHDWDVLLLGTSRVDMGLDPAHPSFTGMRTYNAGLYGADFAELDYAARAAMKRGRLKHLVLCLDMFCFDADRKPPPDRQGSLLNPSLNRADYYFTNLLSLTATQDSLDTWRNAVHHTDGKGYPLGLFVIPDAAHDVQRPRLSWVGGGYLELILPGGIERTGRQPLVDDRFEALSRLLSDAGKAGIKVDVVQLPMHAVAFEAYAVANRWPLYESWVTRLTEMIAAHNRQCPTSPVALWDFAEYDAYSRDSAFGLSKWFYDPFHIRVALGELVLDRIMQYPPPSGTNLDSFGLIVTEANLGPHLARLRRDRQAYKDATRDIAEIDRAIEANLAAQAP